MSTYFSSKLLKITAVIVVGEVACLVLRFLYSKRKKNVKGGGDSMVVRLNKHYHPEKTNQAVFHRVLLFPDEGVICRRLQSGRKCRDDNCRYMHKETSMGFMLKLIQMAVKSLDVCLYLFTSSILGDALVQANEEGVIVTVIIDDHNSGERGDVTGSQIQKLRAAGIKVVAIYEPAWMHHKFMILDNEVLVSGSFNWTNQATMGNFENVIVTSEPQLVDPFKYEFRKLYKIVYPDD